MKNRMTRYSLLILGCALLTACATPPAEPQRHVYSLEVPDTALVLELPSDGLKLEVKDNNPPYYYFTNEKIQLSISFRFERAAKCSSSESCRDYFTNKFSSTDASRKSWLPSRIGEVFISEGGEGSGSSGARQQSMNAHFVKNGMWINVRLAKNNYMESDRELFVKLVKSIQFWPKL